MKVFHKLIENSPDLTPQVILLDGNGILHPRGLGLASHFGVLANICTVGVAKNLYHMDSFKKNGEFLTKIAALQHAGDWFPIEDDDAQAVGAVRTLGNVQFTAPF